TDKHRSVLLSRKFFQLGDSSRLRAFVVKPASNPPRRHEDARNHELFSINEALAQPTTGLRCEGVELKVRGRMREKDGQMTSPYGVRRLVAALLLTPSAIAATSRRPP